MSFPRRVLFLCTGNSARSVLAECLLERLGGDEFQSYSAGSQPKPAPHPRTLSLLRDRGYDTGRLRSKSWDEFAGSAAPPIDLVVTVCGSAAAETCPVFPGAPLSVHWGIDDPAAVEGSDDEIDAAFARAYAEMETRISRFLSLPRDLDGAALDTELRAIGADRGAA